MSGSMTILEQFRQARQVNTPLISIHTADQQATIAEIDEAFKKAPKFQWDAVRGLRAMNDESLDALKKLGDPAKIAPNTGNPRAMLDFAQNLPASSILFAFNFYRFIDDAVVTTGVLLLRDIFKADKRTFVPLGPGGKLPIELQQSVVVLDEPLPDDTKLGSILTGLYSAMNENLAEKKKPEIALNDETAKRGVTAARGLSAFMAEQTFAMSMDPATGLDLGQTWDRKRSAINQVDGLTLETDGPSFDDIAGLSQIRARLKRNADGRNPSEVYLRIDEIEKQLSGSDGGDRSGTSTALLGYILQTMEDYRWTGLIAVGAGGCGKSLVSKAAGREFKRPVLNADLGATKGDGLVGQAEKGAENMLKTVRGIAGGKPVCVIATCNDIDIIPTALRRRFTMGVWYFDLQTKPEREATWKLYFKKYSFPANSEIGFDDTGWTGAEIRNVVEMAYNERMTFAEAATYIVPVSVADPQGIERLRTMADGKFLNASAPGVYRKDESSKLAKVAFGRSFKGDE